MIRRALGETMNPIERARLLGPFVEIVLATADTAAARAAADELRAFAGELRAPLLEAHADRAVGAVLLAEGDARAALVALRRAFNGFNALGVRYDAAQTRLLVAAACNELGDHDAAGLELDVAHAALASLHAQVPSPTRTRCRAPGDLTDRELEVLRLVAQGKTNRVIANELVVSEKTVASHISHVFTKLGVTSRSAATAYAYDHGLV